MNRGDSLLRKMVALAVPLALVSMAFAGELSLFWSFESGSGIWTVATSARGERIAAGSWDHNVYYFDSRGNLLWEFSTGAPIWSVTTTPDSKYVAVGSGDKNVYLLDSEGKQVWQQTTGDTVWSVAISNKGDAVAAGSYDDNIYYFKDGQLAWKHAAKDDVLSVAMSGKGEYVVAGSWDQKVYFLDSNGKLLWEYPTEGIVSSVALSQDGRHIVAGSNDNRIYTFDLNGKLLSKYRLSNDVLSVGISADGRIASAGTRDGGIYIFELAQGNAASELASGLVGKYQAKDEVWSVALSSDGGRIAAASLDNNVYVLDNKAQLIGKYETGSRVTSVAITNDGKRVSAGSYDNRVYFLNIETITPPPVKVEEPPNLRVTRSVSPGSLTEGEYATIKIEALNTGESKASEVNIFGDIPEGFKLVGGENTWFGELSPGEATTLTYTLIALETGKTAVYQLPQLHITYKDDFGTVYHAFGDALPIVVLAKPKPQPPPEVKEVPFRLPVSTDTIIRATASLALATLLVLIIFAILRPRITGEYRPEKLSLIKQLKSEVQGYAVGMRPLVARAVSVPRPTVGVSFFSQLSSSFIHSLEVVLSGFVGLISGVLASLNRLKSLAVENIRDLFGEYAKPRVFPEGRIPYKYHKKGETLVQHTLETTAHIIDRVIGPFKRLTNQATTRVNQLANNTINTLQETTRETTAAIIRPISDATGAFREGLTAILRQIKTTTAEALKTTTSTITRTITKITGTITKLKTRPGKIPFKYHGKGTNILDQLKQDAIDSLDKVSTTTADFIMAVLAGLDQLKDSINEALSRLPELLVKLKLKPAEGKTPYRYHKKEAPLINQIKDNISKIFEAINRIFSEVKKRAAIGRRGE